MKGTPEIVSLSIVMICWLQAAYAVRSGGMIRVDAVHVHLPARAQRCVRRVRRAARDRVFRAHLLGQHRSRRSTPGRSNEFEGEGALRVPAWPARFLVVLGSFLAAFNYLLLAIERLRALVSGRPPPPPASEIKLEERIA